ncbi:MAG: hypothetical protein ACOYON_09185, partial [Fimbriimonas sp.]
RLGSVVRLGQPLFTQYQKVGTVAYRRLVQNLLRLLLPSRLVETSAPTTTEVTVTKTAEHKVVHLVNYSPMRRGDHMEVWEDPTPLRDIEVTVPASWAPNQVVLLPGEEPLKTTLVEGRLTFVVPTVVCHAAVLLR